MLGYEIQADLCQNGPEATQPKIYWTFYQNIWKGARRNLNPHPHSGLTYTMEDTAECWWEGLEWYETEIHPQGISCADNDFRLKTEEEADRQDKTQAGQLNAPAHAVSGSNMELSLVNMEKEKKDTFYFSSCQLVFDRLEEIPKQCTSTSMLDSFFDWENLISIALERCSWCHSGIGLISKFWWTINLCLCTEAWVISQQPPCLKNKLVGLVQDGLQ